MPLTNCKYCNSFNLIRIEREFKNKTLHIEVRCADCNKFNEWEAHVRDENFIMPFGKYEKMKLIDIIENHYSFVVWFIDHSVEYPNIKAKFQRLLKARQKNHVLLLKGKI